MKITVPATSANIGPGFDSVGVAVSKYLTIEVLEPADAWHIEHDLGDIPSDENNHRYLPQKCWWALYRIDIMLPLIPPHKYTVVPEKRFLYP